MRRSLVHSTVKSRETAIKSRKRKEDNGKRIPLLSSGSTCLNLACSDSHRGAFALGSTVNIIGDSSSGKTLLAKTIIAEAARSKEFDEYLFIYDNVERVDHFDNEKLFGKQAVERTIPPKYDRETGNPSFSRTVEDFEYSLLYYLKKEQSFIYVVDSFDSLTSEVELAKADAILKARETGKEMSGSYGAERAKEFSGLFRKLNGLLERSKSILFVISQTRDKIDSAFKEQTRAGGRALKFYSTHEMWLAGIEILTKTVKGKNRKIGQKVRVRVSKNKITGKPREVDFPLYYDYGIDDIRSCIDFLLSEKEWTGSAHSINSKGFFDQTLTREGIIEKVEAEAKERALRRVVQQTWDDIEEALKLNRKRRYE